MKQNTITGDELYVRCIHCGDSQKNPENAHLSINLSSGLYHCFRCQASGKVDAQLLFQLQLMDLPGLDYHTSALMPQILSGPGSDRKSLLDRYHSTEGHDVFYSWWNDQHVGYYFKKGKSKKLWGFAGTNWYRAPLLPTSTPEFPLRFVEGPYDVVNERDVCFFGIPSIKKIRSFYRDQYFILAPDGDLWTSPHRMTILYSLIDQLIRENLGFLGVEFIPQASDPDEMNSSTLIPTDYFKERKWQNISLSSRAQRALGSLR